MEEVVGSIPTRSTKSLLNSAIPTACGAVSIPKVAGFRASATAGMASLHAAGRSDVSRASGFSPPEIHWNLLGS